MTEHRPGFFRRVWLSIFSDPVYPRTERDRKRFVIKYLLLHLRPATVPEPTLRFTLSWGLGGMAVVLVYLGLNVLSLAMLGAGSALARRRRARA